MAPVERRHHADAVAAGAFAGEFHHLLALGEALVAVDGHGGAGVPRPLHGGGGIDLPALQPGDVGPHHVGDAVRVDAARMSA